MGKLFHYYATRYSVYIDVCRWDLAIRIRGNLMILGTNNGYMENIK